MTSWQAFVLGIMAAYTPSMIFLAIALYRDAAFNWRSPVQ